MQRHLKLAVIGASLISALALAPATLASSTVHFSVGFNDHAHWHRAPHGAWAWRHHRGPCNHPCWHRSWHPGYYDHHHHWHTGFWVSSWR